MRLFWNIAHLLLFCYTLVLFLRISISIVRSLDRGWRPRGFMLVTAEVTYSLTDPPLKLLQKYIPPVQLGPVRLDLAFVVLFMIVYILGVITGLNR